MDPSQALDACNDEPPGGHGYGRNTICLFLRLVMKGVSLRGVPRVLAAEYRPSGFPTGSGRFPTCLNGASVSNKRIGT